MRSILILIAVVLSAPVLALEMRAQQKPATFRSSVTLVSVDVTALDKDGRPIQGLTADDFQIKLNGRLQPVRTVDYIQAPQANSSASAGPAADPAAGGRPVVTNVVALKDPKIFILAIDDLSLPPEGGRRTITAARRFVDAQSPAVLVGLMTTSGSVVVNPTLDRAAIANGLKHVVGSFIDPRKPSSPESPSVSIAEAIEIAEHNNTSVQNAAIVRECADGGRLLQTDRGINAVSLYNTKCATDVMSSARLIATLTQGTTNRQITSLSNALGAMKGAPGLKQLVVLSQGVATTRDYLTAFEPVTKAASAAGVQLSVLMEDDDDADLSTQAKGVDPFGQKVGGAGTTSLKREDRKMFLASLQVLADAAGGTFERVISNPDGAFTRAALAGSAVYRLGVEAPSDVSGTKPLEVLAAVRRDGVSLHVNHNAVLPAATVVETAAEQVSAAIKHGKPLFGVPMRVAIARRRAAGNQVELGVGIAVPGTVAGPLHVTIGVIDATGALKQGTREVPAAADHGDYRLTVPMPVAPGKFRVRLAVEDAAGAVGSVDTRVDAELTTMGALTASDLLTWWKDSTGRPQFLALDNVPAGVTNLSAGLELYLAPGASAPADLKVKLSLFAAGAATPIAEIDVSPRLDRDVLRVESSLPLASLSPGAYTIRATVAAGGQRLGEVSATIRKN